MNANGPVWAVDAAHGKYVAVNPSENSAFEIPIPTRDDPKTMRSRFPTTQARPSNFWGQQIVHAGVADPHNAMFDSKGRLWSTSTVSQGVVPDWCKDGKINKFAEYFPRRESEQPACVVLRPEIRQMGTDLHLLRDPSPAVRGRPERDAVLQRRWPDDSLGQHEGVRPDQGRETGCRLVSHGARHQRRRQDHQAVERAGRRRSLTERRGRRRTAWGLRCQARHPRERRQLRHHRQSG